MSSRHLFVLDVSYLLVCSLLFFFFFFNDTATTEIYTLSLHDALPISPTAGRRSPPPPAASGSRHRSRARWPSAAGRTSRSEEHTSELQSQSNLVCRLLLEKKKIKKRSSIQMRTRK